MKNIDKIKNNLVYNEKHLKSYACFFSTGIRSDDANIPRSDEIRSCFMQDIDRIIHSLAYTRYIDKTQVFPYLTDDQISRRITHVQFVSRAARVIARALRLNEDLCEAISLGHDIGHVPFGHEGEYILDGISKKELGQTFAHNVQSVRNFLDIENGGKGSSLTIQTLDGILCHNGELVQKKYKPTIPYSNICNYDDDTIRKNFFEKYNNCYNLSFDMKKQVPMTLEGCVVRISDIIGYIGKDIEDAIRIKKISRQDLPKDAVNILGNNNVDIMNKLITDVIQNSYNKSYISLSDDVFYALSILKEFNLKNIYKKSLTKVQLIGIKEMFNKLYDYYILILNSDDIKNRDCDIFTNFLNNMNDNYLKNTSNQRKVIDYIAGMTDGYMYNCFKQNII